MLYVYAKRRQIDNPLQKKNIFDPKNGARGWILGPLICLWFSGLDSRGPMLFGLIARDGLGTRIYGRAGSDLDGVVAFTLLIPFMAVLVFQMLLQDEVSLRQLLVIGFIFLVGAPVIYWVAHKDRRDAEPLVRFLQNEVGMPKAKEVNPTLLQLRTGLKLLVNDDLSWVPLSADVIRDALLQIGTDDVVILESAREDYIQTIGRGGGYAIERREGSALRHFRVLRHIEFSDTDESAILGFDEAVAAFIAYASGNPMPVFLNLEPVNLQS